MWCVCVCVELQAFCIFGLNCLLAGRSDALRAMTFTGTKLSWILLLLPGVRQKKSLQSGFFCEAVDVKFWF